MRIAQIAPLFESVPPRLYGGTERVVSYLTEELIRQGHQVTLFASGDSITSAELVPCTSRALRLDPNVRDPIPHYTLMLDKVRERAADFDILHFHIDYLHFPLFRSKAARTVTTLHGRQDLADHMPFYRRFSDMPLISISNAQRTPLAARILSEPYITGCRLIFISRVGSRPAATLRFLVASRRRSGLIAPLPLLVLPAFRLKLRRRLIRWMRGYFRQVIAPLLEGAEVEFVGEINESAKTEFLGRAAGLLFPIDWPEPFGLVMIEAMACGTPVLAFRGGSVPEIVEDGLTGRIVSNIEEAVQAVPDLLALDRKAIRARFEQRFSSRRMAADYVRIYERARRHAASEIQLSPAALSAATPVGERPGA